MMMMMMMMIMKQRSNFPDSPGPSRIILGSKPLYNAKNLKMPSENKFVSMSLVCFQYIAHIHTDFTVKRKRKKKGGLGGGYLWNIRTC